MPNDLFLYSDDRCGDNGFIMIAVGSGSRKRRCYLSPAKAKELSNKLQSMLHGGGDWTKPPIKFEGM